MVPGLGWLLPIPFYFMELLVGLVQALVFMLLTAVFTLLICQPRRRRVGSRTRMRSRLQKGHCDDRKYCMSAWRRWAPPSASGLIGMGASTAVGRNPGASTKIMVQSILAIAFAEAIVFYALFLVQ